MAECYGSGSQILRHSRGWSTASRIRRRPGDLSTGPALRIRAASSWSPPVGGVSPVVGPRVTPWL